MARLSNRPPVVPVVFFVLLLATGLRVVPQWSDAIEGGVAVARDPDACYQLRRAELIAKNFPDLATFDLYINYPEGARVIWPPLYALVLAGGVAAFPAPAGAAGCSISVALLTPLLFAATIVALFGLAWRLWPGRLDLAILSAALPALSPANVPYTIVGQMDHHAAEILIVALFVLTLGAATAGVRAGDSPLRRALVPGLVLAAGILVQLTLVLLIPIAFASLFLCGRGALARNLEILAWLFAIAAIVVLPFALAYGAAGAPLRHYQFGLFHAVLLALATLAAVAARAAAAPIGPRVPRIPLLAVASALAALLATRLAPEVAGGVGYVGKSFSSWQAGIEESRALFRDGLWAGLREAIRSFSALVVVFPIGLVAFARRTGARDPHAALLLVAAAVFAILGVLQMRFLAHLSLFVGFAAAAALEMVLGRDPARRWRPALVGAAALAAVIPTIPAWSAPNLTTIAFTETRSVLAALARETPPTSHYDQPRQRPEYAVVSEWSLGHFIEYHGRRPTLVDNFGAHVNDPHRVDALFFETEEARALAFLDSTGGRFVLIRDLFSTLGGLMPSEARMERLIASAAGQAGTNGAVRSIEARTVRFTPAMLRTILYRLAWYDGARFLDPAGGEIEPLRHFRLIAESQETEPIEGGRAVPRTKLFEAVAGARVRVDGIAPGAAGQLRAPIRSPRGRVFPYSERLVADSLGAVEFVLPYPTNAPAGKSAADRCEVRVGAASVPITGITEEMVRAGGRVVVVAPGAASPSAPTAPPP